MSGHMENSIAWNLAALLRSPLIAPLHPLLEQLAGEHFPALADCNVLLAQWPVMTQSGQPLRFVPQEYGKLAFERQYEPRCYLSGEVMTREHNWHDLFNALVWLTFPKAKAEINARHYAALTGEQEKDSQRGAVRDMNTLLDESGVIVACAEADLAELLRGFRWKELFWQKRERVKAGMGVFLFGHGLYEKAMQPYVGLTGQGLVLPVVQEFFAWPQARQLSHLDDVLSAYLHDQRHCRDTRELTPLPLLGMPGWTTDNECEAYYDNERYFRPGRRANSHRHGKMA